MILLLGKESKEIKSFVHKRFVCEYSSRIVHNSKERATKSLPSDKQMNRMWYSHTEYHLAIKNKRNSDTCCNMN